MDADASDQPKDPLSPIHRPPQLDRSFRQMASPHEGHAPNQPSNNESTMREIPATSRSTEHAPVPPDSTVEPSKDITLGPRGMFIDIFSTSDDDEPGSSQGPGAESSLRAPNQGGASEDVELAEESSELLATQVQGQLDRGRSKWVKLRSTIKVACAFTPSTRKRHQLERQDSFLKRFSTRQAGSQYGEDSFDGKEPEDNRSKETETRSPGNFVINPDETFMFVWLTGLACTVLYNLWTCIAREAFPEIRNGFEPLWFTADALCDLVYLFDVAVQMRTGYLERGLIVYDSLKLTKHYVYSRDFVLDMVALLPLDLIQIYIGVHPLVRFPRFVKAYRLYRFMYMVETRTAFPNMWRVANLSHVLFLGCHWFAAFYFLISKAEQFSTGWGYPTPVGEYASVTQKYLRSLYWSTLTLTTIGDLQSPESNWEFAFTITSYLIGVFVFATIVGQVGNVITNQNASRQEFERHLDGAKAYMRYHNVPRDIQQRVQRWYDYAWSRGRMNGGGDINSLGLLPDKLKTELALHVNLETLKKVAIFHKCEPEFLHDLVLKMKAYIFTPGDLICRKGEVAREMFIIADGLVEVVSDSGEVLKQMGAGDFFGEIGILNLDGGVNRRTADVRSLGYSELFVLSRDDVLAAFKDHPEAEVLIKEYGEKRLKELDEHKRRKLCEKLAKELTSTNSDGSGGTVGKMVLSTGLLHGIGIGASSRVDRRPPGTGPAMSQTLPNGLGQVDRWSSVLKMAMSGRSNANDVVPASSVERVETGQACRNQSGVTKPVESDETSRACPEAGRARRPFQERILFRGLRRRNDDDSDKDDAKTDTVGEPKSLKREQITDEDAAQPKGGDVMISRRLASIFSKRRGAQPKPYKLWSLGVVGKGRPVTRLVTPEVRHAEPNAIVTVGPSSAPAAIAEKTVESNNNAKDAGKAVEPHAKARRNLCEITGPEPPAYDSHSSVQSTDRPIDRQRNKSNSSASESFKRTSHTERDARDAKPLSRLSAQSSASAAARDGCSVGVTSKLSASSSGDQRSKTPQPDLRVVCSEISDVVRDVIQRELMAVESQYQRRLQKLEAEIASKQTTIDRLNKEINALKSTQ